MTVTETQPHLYWATGCTSCLRAKEFLERNDVSFVSHNIAEDMSLLDEMEEQGLPRQVPVIERGDEWADAQNLDEVARIAGIEYRAEPLPVDELYRRLKIILERVEAYTERLPEDRLDGSIANRPRTVGQLVFHTFSIPESFLEHEEGIRMDNYETEPEWANESTESLVTYGRHIQARLRDWAESRKDERDWDETADVYYGSPTVHKYFERTAWHAGQHARQLESLLEERFEIDVDPLDAELWEGLPMPEKVWNESSGDETTDGRVNIIEATNN